jgi:hypothetical protein
MSWKCSWGAVELPVCPTRPITSPTRTAWPVAPTQSPEPGARRPRDSGPLHDHVVPGDRVESAPSRIEPDRVPQGDRKLANHLDPGPLGHPVHGRHGTVALSDHPVRLPPLRRSKTTDHGTVEWFDPFLASFHEGEPPRCWASPAHSGSRQQCRRGRPVLLWVRPEAVPSGTGQEPGLSACRRRTAPAGGLRGPLAPVRSDPLAGACQGG